MTDDGIVLKGNRIFMPESIHVETQAKLYESHQGVEKMRLRARSCMFWNGINRDIEVDVRKCAIYPEVHVSNHVRHSCHTRHLHVLVR